MSPGEVSYRVGQALRRQARRLGSSRGRIERGTSLPIPTGPPHRIAFYDIELSYPDAAVDWQRDYRNGVRAPLRFSGDIDYRDPRQVGDAKYVWELNRHQFLAPWALEFADTGDERHAMAVVRLILEWTSANPAHRGVNWVSSLELALRVLSWGIALDLCRDAAIAKERRDVVAASVLAQARSIRANLSLYSSANNHLVGELVGLLAASAFFPEVDERRRVATFARDRLAREADVQNLPDGVNREQAFHYHHYTLEYLLTARSLLTRIGWEPPPRWTGLLRRMLDFVDAMADDAGRPFEVGDNDGGTVTGLNLATGVGVCESLLWTGWALFGEPRFGAHAARIARTRQAPPAIDRRTAYWHPEASLDGLADTRPLAERVFPQGGYFVRTDGPWTLLFKAGPFGYPSIAAHAHCDQLSVLLRREARTVLADAGTYVYHADPRWRDYFRGTSAHNTVRVDGEDQARSGGAFLWSTRADAALEILVTAAEVFEVRGAHDGYGRLPDPVRHERCVAFRRGNGYRVTDRLRGAGSSHLYELFWNLGAGLGLEPLGAPAAPGAPFRSAWRVLSHHRPLLTILVAADRPATARVLLGDESAPGGFESLGYLRREPAHQICVATAGRACTFETFLIDGAATSSTVAEWR
jgi:hypothetical protein